MILLIKQAKDAGEAKLGLMQRAWHPAKVIDILTRAASEGEEGLIVAAEGQYGLAEDGYYLSPEQAQSILEMRLHRLTGLEQDKITAEHGELKLLIINLTEIVSNPERLMQVIRNELLIIRDQFGDERRTERRRCGDAVS
jgi:DNA gyrase subunit A